MIFNKDETAAQSFHGFLVVYFNTTLWIVLSTFGKIYEQQPNGRTEVQTDRDTQINGQTDG